MSDITIAGFEALIGDSYALDRKIDELEATLLAPLRKELQELDAKILAQLEASELSSFKTKFGTVVRTRRYSVRVPATAEDKAALFDWLKTKGDAVYWRYTTVNSQALNSLYKAEMEIAKEEGNTDFKIPGLGLPEMSQTLSRRTK